MGGTSLISKGILSPIEGDVTNHYTELPLTVEYEVNEMSIVLPDEILVDAGLPDEITTDILLHDLTVEIEVPLLETDIRLEE